MKHASESKLTRRRFADESPLEQLIQQELWELLPEVVVNACTTTIEWTAARVLVQAHLTDGPVKDLCAQARLRPSTYHDAIARVLKRVRIVSESHEPSVWLWSRTISNEIGNHRTHRDVAE